MDYGIFTGKFFGLDKIIKVSPASPTYLGGERVEIEFESGKKRSLPLEALQSSFTEEKLDLSSLRDKLVDPLVLKILSLITDSELTVDDINYAIGPRLVESLNNAIDRAHTKIWGKPKFELTYRDLDDVLVKDKKQEDKKYEPRKK